MKTVLITGVNRGIGKALAEKYLAEKYRVIGTTRSGKVANTHPLLYIVQLDLASEKSIVRCVKGLKNFKIDILINNAGVLLDFLEHRVCSSVLKKTLEINLIGTILFSEQMLSHFKQGGRIIFISSSNGLISRTKSSEHSSYNISKAGLNMYARCLAFRVDPSLKVSVVMPGLTDTQMGRLGKREPVVSPETIARLIYSFSRGASKKIFMERKLRSNGIYSLTEQTV